MAEVRDARQAERFVRRFAVIVHPRRQERFAVIRDDALADMVAPLALAKGTVADDSIPPLVIVVEGHDSRTLCHDLFDSIS